MNPSIFDYEALDRFLKEKVGTTERDLENFAKRIGVTKRTLDKYRRGEFPESLNVLAALHFHLILPLDSPLFREPS